MCRRAIETVSLSMSAKKNCVWGTALCGHHMCMSPNGDRGGGRNSSPQNSQNGKVILAAAAVPHSERRFAVPSPIIPQMGKLLWK